MCMSSDYIQDKEHYHVLQAKVAMLYGQLNKLNTLEQYLCGFVQPFQLLFKLSYAYYAKLPFQGQLQKNLLRLSIYSLMAFVVLCVVCSLILNHIHQQNYLTKRVSEKHTNMFLVELEQTRLKLIS